MMMGCLDAWRSNGGGDSGGDSDGYLVVMRNERSDNGSGLGEGKGSTPDGRSLYTRCRFVLFSRDEIRFFFFLVTTNQLS
jgi:hypothetical protein